MSWLEQQVRRGEVIVWSAVALIASVLIILSTRSEPTEEALKSMRELQQKTAESERKIGHHADRIAKAIEEFETIVMTQSNSNQINMQERDSSTEQLTREVLENQGHIKPKESHAN